MNVKSSRSFVLFCILLGKYDAHHLYLLSLPSPLTLSFSNRNGLLSTVQESSIGKRQRDGGSRTHYRTCMRAENKVKSPFYFYCAARFQHIDDDALLTHWPIAGGDAIEKQRAIQKWKRKIQISEKKEGTFYLPFYLCKAAKSVRANKSYCRQGGSIYLACWPEMVIKVKNWTVQTNNMKHLYFYSFFFCLLQPINIGFRPDVISVLQKQRKRRLERRWMSKKIRK